MKIKVLGFIFGLIVGLIVGSCCVGFVWFFKETRRMFDPVPIILSSQEIHDRIQIEGVFIPRSALDIRYHRMGFQDSHKSWFAFSDKADAISDFTKHHSFVVSEKIETQRPWIYNNKDFNAVWWPKSFENCDFYEKKNTWMAYDRMNCRVYIHVWS